MHMHMHMHMYMCMCMYSEKPPILQDRVPNAAFTELNDAASGVPVNSTSRSRAEGSAHQCSA